MKKLFCLLAIAFFFGKATAAPSSPLIGLWLEVDGPGIARIEPCANNRKQLCAMGLSRRSGAVAIETGIALSAIQPTGENRWRGSYHDGKRKLPATLRMANANRVEMKVCILVLCQTATYTRQR